MKKVAVVLSGCGFKDGAEITESVSTLIALTEARAQYQIFAPDIIATTTNHLTDVSEGTHSVLAEAARIARGNIKNLTSLNPKEFDALIFPGGYGAAKHLCTFAHEGSKGQVLPEVSKAIAAFRKEDKPIGAFCIAPALIALVLGQKGVTLSIGEDVETAREIEKTGAVHVPCAVDDFITDREFKVVTSPAYMYDGATAFQVYTGIRRAVREIIEMA